MGRNTDERNTSNNSKAAKPHQQLYRFLDLNGDGTGTKNLVGDYTTPDIAYIQPPAGQIYHLARLIVHIEDGAPISAVEYGGLAALTNGITVRVQDASGTLVNLTDGVPIKSNAGFGRYCYDVVADTFGSGNDFIQVRWTFERTGQYLRLDGDKNERLEVTLADNLTGLVAHYFMVQGFRVK